MNKFLANPGVAALTGVVVLVSNLGMWAMSRVWETERDASLWHIAVENRITRLETKIDHLASLSAALARTTRQLAQGR